MSSQKTIGGAPSATARAFRASFRARKTIASLCLLLLPMFVWPGMARAQGAGYQTVRFKAPHLEGKTMSFDLILPRGYATSHRRFPVLYLLHGYTGNYTNWVKLTKIVRYARPYEELIVMPDAANSWYVNNYADPKMQWEDYIIDDLIPYVDAHYRTIAARRGRAIAGLSMGGYGALYLGLKYHNLFCAVASLSGVVASADLSRWDPAVWEMVNTKWPKMKKVLLDDFGPVTNPVRKAEDPFRLIRKLMPKECPALFLAVGESDPFLHENREFVKLLARLKIPYHYHEVPGGHQWSVWNEEIQPVLRLQAPILGAH